MLKELFNGILCDRFQILNQLKAEKMQNVHVIIKKQMAVYDALYAWCRLDVARNEA